MIRLTDGIAYVLSCHAAALCMQNLRSYPQHNNVLKPQDSCPTEHTSPTCPPALGILGLLLNYLKCIMQLLTFEPWAFCSAINSDLVHYMQPLCCMLQVS